MTIVGFILGGLGVLYVGLIAPVLLVRNNNVKNYRLRLIDSIHAAASEDALRGLLDYKWRYDAFERVTHNRMVFQFWRSFDSFYPDRSFAKPRRGVSV